jgi:cyanophycin synthetase
MKILDIQILRGPNFWSSEHKKLIVLHVHLNELTESQTRDLVQKAVQVFPGLSVNYHIQDCLCTGIVQVVKYLALEIQNSAGFNCSFRKSKAGASKGEYFIVYEYELEQPGEFAAEAAIRITEAFIQNNDPQIENELQKIQQIRKKYDIGPTSHYLLSEILQRNIPCRQFENGSLMTIGYGTKQKKIRTAVTDSTSGLGMEIVGDKDETKKILNEAGIPVPQGIIVYSEKGLTERIHEVRFPLVVKPLDGNHGRGVTTNINSLEKALVGYELARKISRTVIVEEFIKGNDYRFLIINYKLVAVAKRTPANITGNGKSTIRELIDEENKNTMRGSSAAHVLAQIKVDSVTENILSEHNFTLDSILPDEQNLVLKGTANISAGGTAEDVTDRVHPETRFTVERIARLFNLDICGVDILASSIDVPFTREVGAVIEVNAGPGLRMHSNPQIGKSRNVAAPIIDMLMPTEADARIPVIAVTGTNGKTTTTRLIAHLAKHIGYTPGYCTTDGIYIDNHLTHTGDCTGFRSAQDVLFDPGINFAVLECARGGILKSGLGFSNCDISIVTNVTEDHIGLKGINSLEDMARVKAVVAKTTRKEGYSILNAENDLCYKIKDELDCHVALFSTKKENERIREHLEKGGIAAVIHEKQFVICKGKEIIPIEKIEDVPLTLDGKASYMIKNVLPAILAAYLTGMTPEQIRKGLNCFYPSPLLTPGRMNIYNFSRFKLMVDYAHNTDGFYELKRFLDQLEDSPKTGIIAVPGDRRDDDIRNIGLISATMFDRIIIKHDTDLRGRTHDELNNLLIEGIKQLNKEVPTQIISEEKEAIDTALAEAEKGSFILVATSTVAETIDYVNQLHKMDSLTSNVL